MRTHSLSAIVFLLLCLGLFSTSCGSGGDDDDDNNNDDTVADDDNDDNDESPTDDDDDDDDNDDDNDNDDTGAEILNETFDAMTIGLPPDAPWLAEATGGTLLIANVFPMKGGSGNVVEMNKTGSGGSDYALLEYPFATALTTDLSYSADLYFATDAVAGFRLWSIEGASWDECVYTMDYDVAEDSFQIGHSWDGSSFAKEPCAALTWGAWTTFKVTIDWTAKTSTTYVDGVACATEVPFWSDSTTQVKVASHLLIAGSPASQMFVDNVVVRAE